MIPEWAVLVSGWAVNITAKAVSPFPEEVLVGIGIGGTVKPAGVIAELLWIEDADEGTGVGCKAVRPVGKSIGQEAWVKEDESKAFKFVNLKSYFFSRVRFTWRYWNLFNRCYGNIGRLRSICRQYLRYRWYGIILNRNMTNSIFKI